MYLSTGYSDFAIAITEVMKGEGEELLYTPTPISTPTPPTPTSEPAGFEAVFAVAGLLAVLYLIRETGIEMGYWFTAEIAESAEMTKKEGLNRITDRRSESIVV